jgi:3',5'-cyclic AMP phosphodiesterase CpdA
MKRLLIGLGGMGLVLVAAALSRTDPPKPQISPDLQVQVDSRNPWNHLRVNRDPDDFRFAIVSDRTGGARAGVFEQAVEQLNWLQPEFVLSVGDLIQGTADPVQLTKQWQEFDGFISRLQMPFFYLPGNHDLPNPLADQHWQDKFGRRYYHFVYKNVLFLMLNSEDPPGVKSGRIGEEQLAYARRVLDENRGVRWTVVALHKPLWTDPGLAKNGWLDVEKALADRKYTVFAGHKHRYERFLRNGRMYYQLATTGGSSKMRGLPLGEFDQLVWVTMKKDGPVLVNLMMEGIFPEDIATRAPEPAPTN